MTIIYNTVDDFVHIVGFGKVRRYYFQKTLIAALRIITAVPAAASSRARSRSPNASIASCGHAPTHCPLRTHNASSIRTTGPSTAMASTGHTLTHARQPTHLSLTSNRTQATRRPADGPKWT